MTSKAKAVRDILKPFRARGDLRVKEVEALLKQAFNAGEQSVRDEILKRAQEIRERGPHELDRR